MLISWRSALSLLLASSLFFFDEWISTPSCRFVPRADHDPRDAAADDRDGLKVMIASDLLLMGSDAGFVDTYFGDYYLSKFFKKSFQTLKPDMLVVLGDFSARGSELTRRKWVPVLRQFHRLIGSLITLPFHVILGDRDIGDCSELDSQLVDWISSHLPGLDSAGCGAFEMENITFLSLNSVALLCGNNALRFGVEEVIERESLDFQTEIEGARTEMTNDFSLGKEMSPNFAWRENSMESGSGPVLLLHFPLHPTGRSRNDGQHCHEKAYSNSLVDVNELWRRLAGSGPYESSHNIPPNATEYIFQALRPRIVFSGHSLDFCDYRHQDGTREVTVPAMSWHARDDPGFVIATFRPGKSVGISHCSLGRQSYAIIYIFMLVLLMLMILLVKFLTTFRTIMMAVALL
ncbi:metallophosphoesterase 1-like isoform X2 [Rhodamnia argentea]|uniref:Metallophosphoesterase 1-like isoform X2 n=1 Tax=Rhodamnia argentea TaxID=178133 RepID=A0ABM3GZW4_9MYRT|nr:metallophosphoesterase 1-like isoform X2 [Rhodamnia argentea]